MKRLFTYLKEEKENEILGIILIALSLIILVSLISYDPGDLKIPSPQGEVRNFAGWVGAHTARFLFRTIDIAALFLPLIVGFIGWRIFEGKDFESIGTKGLGVILFLSGFCSLLNLGQIALVDNNLGAGGVLGIYLSWALLRYFGPLGAYIIIFTFLVLSILLVTEVKFLPLLIRMKERVGAISKERRKRTGIAIYPKVEAKEEKAKEEGEEIREEVKVKEPEEELKLLEEEITYQLPTLSLLDEPQPTDEAKVEEDLVNNANILEATLRDFGIEAEVVQINRGPVITRYDLHPAPGVKVNRIVGLADDIALAMKTPQVRIIAPIPGKAALGIEIPNREALAVCLKEVLSFPQFQEAESKLTIALGKEISGEPLFADLAEMPHLLIAGATGSGKSVCVKSLVMSILYKAKPKEVKFLMIDPKLVELAIFNGIPHLISPVVTDPKRASLALKWVVEEMEERYRLFATWGVRNIEGYNNLASQGLKGMRETKGEEEIEPPLERLPYIVVIIDELADLMLIAYQDVEETIARLTQLSRAVGIHLVLATQRPSVDVITGVIKANFPARIAFQVSSKVDSRTILDMNGAEALLGRGDMLFLPPGVAKPIRAQGAYVSDEEIERVVNFLKKEARPVYEEGITKAIPQVGLEGEDPLYKEAVRLVIIHRLASASFLQRKLKIGYARAARLIDMMEERGVVGPQQGSKPREVLVGKEYLEEEDKNKGEEYQS